MTGFNYAAGRATADRLIARFGQAGAIRRKEDKPDNPEPWKPEQTEVDYPCKLVVLEYSAYELQGTLIEANDRKVYVAAGGLAVEPAVADKVIIGGSEFTIIRVSPLNPAGVVVYYELQVRG